MPRCFAEFTLSEANGLSMTDPKVVLEVGAVQDHLEELAWRLVLAFLGLPPFFPFALEAACFARLLHLPPI
jgi:hypothetical protein